MSTRTYLLIGAMTLALSVGWSAAGFADHADQNFEADHTSNATAGGNTSDQDDITNRNENKGNAFQGTKGVVSEVQNNGANAAINNGNSVSASIATGADTGNVHYTADSSQSASQAGGSVVTETDVDDDNLIEDFAFQDAQGVISKVQNNGAESAINNGNAVAAAILEGATGTTTLEANSSQSAAVDGGEAGNSYTADPSSNDNDIRDSAFQNTEGVTSAAQNNGPNSALNNGNSVAAVIGPGGVVAGGPSTFTTDSEQSATVDGSNSSTETANTDTNRIRNQAFQNVEGVVSALQNNGANSSLNNGNTVAAVVNVATEGQADLDSAKTATAVSSQLARVRASDGEVNSNSEAAGSDDSNTITNDAFGNAQGVVSALQNNGANSAANNGNTVSAVIAEDANGGGNQTFSADSAQTARVDANPLSGNLNEELASDDTNTLTGNSFQDAAGVLSALQNNGANSALNNGNTVSAFVMTPDVGVHGSPGSLQTPDDLSTSQSATVEANASLSGDPDGNENLEGGTGGNRVFDTNTMTANTFETAEGVMSALQNNGANSAINNGNAVSAIVANGRTSPERTADFDTTSTQSALVTNNDGAGNNGGRNLSVERRDDNPLGNPDNNTIATNAFRDAAGVMSAGQNNGANSAINNGNTVAAVIGHGGQGGATTNTSSGDELTATATQTATVQSLFGSNPADGNHSEEANSPDSNTISDNAFSSAQGVGSVFQNNGANTAINNGNTLSAIITDTKVASRAKLAADSRQVARVSARAGTLNRDQQGNVSGFNGSLPSDESNLLTDDAFNESEGVFSVLQNNGPNSALNNGNTVAAFIADGNAETVNLDAASELDTNQDGGFNSVQRAIVEAGDGGSANDSRQQGSNDSNRIDTNVFRNVQGVVSALQNNGGNSAINNGNTVAAVIAEDGIDGDQTATFNADHDQTARVDADAGTNASEAGDFAPPAPVGSGDSDATNRLTDNAFQGAEGVLSVGQNNGANTAANNGNAVSAFIADGAVDVNGTNEFTTDGSQAATVEATGGGSNDSIEADDSDDTNTIDSAAFESTQGVGSVLQNNGPNSAINNGNTVAAVINACTDCTGTMTFAATSTQTSTVDAASASASSTLDSDNTNSMTGSAFANAAGVFSVTQNNGPNSAISNGNTVSAVIVNN